MFGRFILRVKHPLKMCFMRMINMDLTQTKIYPETCFGKSCTKHLQREQKLFSPFELLMKERLIELSKSQTLGSFVGLVWWFRIKEWFDSFYRFEKQEASKWSYFGNFDIRGLGLSRRGYMGKKWQNMGEGF